VIFYLSPPSCDGKRINPMTPLRLASKRFRLAPVRSPLLRRSHSVSFPPDTKMFQFSGLSSLHYEFMQGCSDVNRNGFPHSAISGLKDVCSYPELIATYYGLRRPPSPRHSPCALTNLTISFYPTSKHSCNFIAKK
jgi:hypothetical protein